MALIKTIHRAESNRHNIHESVWLAECAVFSQDGSAYVQLNTFGSERRKGSRQPSQEMQFTLESATELVEIFREAFPELH